VSARALLLPLLALLQALGAQQQAQFRPPPVQLPDDWAARDLEGRWVAYRRDLEAWPQDQDRGRRWAERLGEAGDFDLLEWIGLYEGYRFAGPVLRRQGAPQLFRVALWSLYAVDSHNQDNAKKALLEGGGQALGWFERYPEARRGRGAAILEQLRNKGMIAADPAPMLPPLDPVQFLVPQLDVPAELADFGSRTRAEPKVRYVHQVLRALDGVLVWGEADEMHAHKILGLMRHGNATVREAAARTLTKLPGELVPWQPLLRAADQAGDDPGRRLAALVLSFSRHPQAFFELHRLALDASHPGADTVLARLGDIGDAYTVAAFAAPAADPGPRQQQFAAAMQKIQARMREEDLAAAPQLTRAYLERVGWLRNANDPRAAAAAAATLATLRPKLGVTFVPVLEAAMTFRPPQSALRGDERAAVERAVAAWIEELRTDAPR
jgi:hypothetical protein